MSEARPELIRYVSEAYPRSRLEPLAGDASTRRFYRLVFADGGTAVVMDYGAPFDGLTDDVRLARVFQEAGLRVAEILDVVPGAGCLILEDLGDRTLEREVGDRRAAGLGLDAVYAPAVDLAVDLAERGTAALSRSERAIGPALDEARFRFEMEFFLEQFATAHLKLGEIPETARRQAWALAAEAAATPSRVLCHRDYHSRNLMVLGDGSLAMVDIQDARWGPDTYDLASLVCDAYVDLDPGAPERWIETYRTALREPPARDGFEERFAVVALERMVKALGTFGYQAEVRGRRSYLDAVPRTVRRIRGLRERLPRYAALIDLLDSARV